KARYVTIYHLNILGKEWGPPLMDALKDEDKDVRRSAAEALGNRQEARAAPLLEKLALKDKDRGVRMTAVSALTGLRPVATTHLLETLRAEDGDVRNAALNALTAEWADLKVAVPGMARLLKDDSVTTRRTAAYGLSLLGSRAKEAAPALKAALKDADGAVRGYV